MWESDNLEVGTGESESLATATWYTGVGEQVARRKIREALCLHTNVGLQRWASLTGLGNTYPYAISSSFRISPQPAAKHLGVGLRHTRNMAPSTSSVTITRFFTSWSLPQFFIWKMEVIRISFIRLREKVKWHKLCQRFWSLFRHKIIIISIMPLAL